MTRPMPGPPEHCCCRDGDQPCGLWLDGAADLYPWYPRDICPGCALHNGDRGSRETRLTEAECSAEYWRAEAEDMSPAADNEMITIPEFLRLTRELATWRRFSHTPHYDEVVNE